MTLRNGRPTVGIGILAGLLLTALLALPSGAAANHCHVIAAPNCDFGDAPDNQIAYEQGPGRDDDIIGQFPSLRTSGGSAHHQVFPPPVLRLGVAEDPEADSKQINIDSGDDGFRRRLTRCKVGTISFTVDTRQVPSNLLTRRHKLYLNFWSDWNFDGDWKDVDDRCGKKKKRKKAKKGSLAFASAKGKGNKFGDDLGSKKARNKLKSPPVPEWRVQNFALNAARFAGRRIQTITLKIRAGGQVADFGPKNGQSLAPFECHRAVVTLDERFLGKNNDGRGDFGFGETEDYCPFSNPFGPPPPPPPPSGGPGETPPPPPPPDGGETSKRVGPLELTPCTNATYFFDVYIPEDALSPTHQLLMPGTDTPITPPICPGATETVTVEEYGPGVTPPGGDPPPAGKRTYRVKITVNNPTGSTSQSFDINVDWTNP